ncbi:YVTN family beta-propeller protein [Chitinophaga niastensis]|uniref:YVTN family beta-propeller protein n=1 Tax=Chitinophaga niastensis TaxID=536980 RepID=A0A2P8HJB3_CHINA|nr:alkaline phosphatase family protein [Chitinophaga niastensis]PSL46301.1 YVTN family beta-propeller protein [Chitinophaga niastensis]
MRYLSMSLLLGFNLFLTAAAFAQNKTNLHHAENSSPAVNARIELPNGWSLTPAGESVPLSSDLPLNMALSPDGNYVAVTNNGNGKQNIDLINLKEKKRVQEVPVGTAWLGLTFGKKYPYLYASGGNNNIIVRYILDKNRLINKDTLTLGLPWPKDKISPTGLTLDEKNKRLYVVTKENNALYACDLQTMKPIRMISLSAEAYTCVLNPVLPELYISAWGGRKIWVYNTHLDKLVDSVTVEDHPNDMAISCNGKWLYVANANSNTVSVVNSSSKKVVETVNAALYPDAPIGSTTNSVALSADDKTLYIANADNNCLAVFDVSKPGHSSSKGFIPTGWYPTCVRVWGKHLLVTNGKGMSSMPNPNGSDPLGGKYNTLYKKSDTTRSKPFQYIGSMFHGTLSVIPVPTESMLNKYARQVYLNTPYTKEKELVASGEPGNPIPTKQGDVSPIKYVFYVLKENRTYDQVLGDMPEGNGDSSRCIFGRHVTPNAHALSEEYVLLDNFYVDAEVSADGHNWSMAGYATDFVEKNWPSNYSGRGGTYDFDGSRAVANPTKGFIWNYCQRAGISFRNYGEFMDNGYPTISVLKDTTHYCKNYPGWNLDIQDIYREQVFEHDFDSLVQAKAVPHFNTVYLPNDHTSGMSKGSHTPLAHVADNDLALGRLVEHISHSPIWKEAAIFVLEDDAQDGPDHVDAHRSVAYVISPYIKRHSVNHTMYSTASMLRTMELVLGLPPMSQYDAAATPMWGCFQPTADNAGYQARPAYIDINARNIVWNQSAIQSAQFDFSKADAIPDLPLNEVIWKSVKGESSMMPAPRRSAFVRLTLDKDDD